MTDAVIAVPAKFDDTQRRLTLEAAEKAGLHVMRLISEPTAAAIAYGATQLGGAAPRTILVFDMGAGTLDVSIVRVAGAKFQVLASAGNLHLGGEDFDDRLLNHFAGEFHAKTGKDIRNNPNALARLRAACERAKRTLSSRSETK